MSKQIVIVTGASRGIGAATARLPDRPADEVAEAIVWLLSDKASYVTGEFINVTGGAR